MRNLKFLSSLAFVIAGLACAPAVIADAIKVADIQANSIVTDEGIDLGQGQDFLPVPEGNWTVKLVKKDIELWGTEQIKVPFVSLFLANNDPNAAVSFVWVKFNPEIRNIGVNYKACEEKYAGEHFLMMDFKTQPRDSLYRCSIAHYLGKMTKKRSSTILADEKFKNTSLGDFARVILENPDGKVLPENKNLIRIWFPVHYRTRFSTDWFFYLRADGLKKADFERGSAPYQAVEAWVNKTGDGIAKFVQLERGKKNVLPSTVF
jgi:hypothetical protein